MGMCYVDGCGKNAGDQGFRLCRYHITTALRQLEAIPDLWDMLQGVEPLLPIQRQGERLHAHKPSSQPPANLSIIAIRDLRTDWQQPGDLLNPQIALGEITAWIYAGNNHQTQAPHTYSVRDSCRVISSYIRTGWALQQPQTPVMADTIRLVYLQVRNIQPDVHHQPSRYTAQCPSCHQPIKPTDGGAYCACTTYTHLELAQKLHATTSH